MPHKPAIPADPDAAGYCLLPAPDVRLALDALGELLGRTVRPEEMCGAVVRACKLAAERVPLRRMDRRAHKVTT